jgi:hypothetical protein
VNKTLYLPDEYGPLWDQARELSGNKLSPIVLEALKSYVLKKEAESKGVERIVVSYEDAGNNNVPTSKAFYGRWIYSPENAYHYCVSDEFDNSDDEDWYAVAQTSKGNIAILSWYMNIREGSDYGHRLTVFPSLEAAAADPRFNTVARHVIEKLGVPVEELDI